MKSTKFFYVLLFVFLFISKEVIGQEYFLKNLAPFNTSIPSPEAFLGYAIGSQHTRHDQIVAYFEMLAKASERVTITVYGKTHENRKLVMLTVTAKENLNNLEIIKQQHLDFTNPNKSVTNYNEVPIFVQLGYNVHGNEPSSAEAALLMAYTLAASNNSEVLNYLHNAVVFIDPAINPDGRDRHTQRVNQFKSYNLVADNIDAEHNEAWPRGRTNHYWFDLNRDWLPAVHPESKGKLKWYHNWYPNVVTDFHEMGTNSTYFFEPMKAIGSKDPIIPKENYEDLNNLFAPYFVKALDSLGSFYFTKEAFDGTYPGYGSSYPDLQGALALLFEQASSRGHVQNTPFGKITFPFTIRNQFISSLATLKAAVNNKAYLRKYQQKFFKLVVNKLPNSGYEGYQFGDKFDKNRNKAFIDLLLLHKIKVFKSGEKFQVPLRQKQQKMVQTMFETYKEYRDSVYYDASAWSLANAYNMSYKGMKSLKLGTEISSTNELVTVEPIKKSSYAYIIDWDDYNAPGLVYYLQANKIKVAAAFKPFSIKTNSSGIKNFNYGSVLVPVSRQQMNSDKVFDIIRKAQQKFKVPVYSVASGFSTRGIDLGSRNFKALQKPKVALLIGNGVSSYEAGEVWHLFDTKVQMPVTKLQLRNFNSANLNVYNTLVMVSGNYKQLDSVKKLKIKNWVRQGNTLITIANASKWVVEAKIVNEQLVVDKIKNNHNVMRKPFVDASENIGREKLGGVILKADLDVTHPLGFGYHRNNVPIYKNNRVFLKPSNNAYATVAKYTNNPHVDGFISDKNLESIKKSASILVSKLGKGRVILFADNPNFRGTWYGTNKLFLNGVFLGNHMNVPTN